MKYGFFGLVVFSLSILAAPARSTIVRSMNLDQLAHEADAVIHGRITHRSSSWNDTKSRIYTVTQVEVIETIKGQAKAQQILKIRQIGGTVDGITQTIVGNASLTVGEEVVLFLDRDEKKPLYYVIGMAQGKYTVDRTGAKPRVAHNLAGLALAEMNGEQLAQIKHTEKATKVSQPTLVDFKAQIKAALRR